MKRVTPGEYGGFLELADSHVHGNFLGSWQLRVGLSEPREYVRTPWIGSLLASLAELRESVSLERSGSNLVNMSVNRVAVGKPYSGSLIMGLSEPREYVG